jgi:ABC-type transporter Mla maintaining outer membrane lipid asymmetry ATPase subunit MlaF
MIGDHRGYAPWNPRASGEGTAIVDGSVVMGVDCSLAPTVEFVGVSMAFGGETVLDELSLTVPAGRTTVVMGPSGVGKTTLVRTLLGLYVPESGTVLVDGRAVADMGVDELNDLRRGMGVLLGGSQVYDSSLFGSISVFENVAYPLRAAGQPAPAADSRTWALLHEFGLADAAERLPVALSAGERRRVALAKALVADPPLLVLDDPGPAVDLLNRDGILRSIERHRRSSGATCVLITHDVDLARKLGDELAVLLDGRVVAAGAPGELLDGVLTAEDFDSRFGFSGHFLQSAPAVVAASARRARRQGLVEAWILMAVLLAIVAALSLAIASGVLDNPAV